jgi:hypothetical protein
MVQALVIDRPVKISFKGGFNPYPARPLIQLHKYALHNFLRQMAIPEQGEGIGMQPPEMSLE